METINYISKLNELAMTRRLEVRYDDLGSSGPDHMKKFTQRVVVNGKEYPPGDGKNKKEARQNAAKNALKDLLEEDFDSMENVAETSVISVTPKKSINYISWLYEYGQSMKVNTRAVETPKVGPKNETQWCHFVVGDKQYPGAYGKTKKEAKEEAAKQAYLEINGSKTTEETSRSAVSDDGSPQQPSTPPSLQDSGCAKSNMPVTPTPNSDAFTNSSKPSKQQDQSPCVRPKLRIAANFPNAYRSSKEDIMPNFKRKNTENTMRKESPTQSGTSRFTTDFDSIKRLGKGAFGRVFKARYKLEEKDYAIKIVGYKEKAMAEVRVLSDLNHSNIVRYFSCWLEDTAYQWETSADSSSSSQPKGESSGKYLYIQMELCDTKTLRLWIDDMNTQNVKKSLRDSKRRKECLTIAGQIISGVEYIHSKMLIHRDLKPANIMFGRDGEVKIGDFGLVTDENPDPENLVERSEYKGTPSYMAPEQKNKSTYDRKVDIYALGLIYFELLWNISTGHERVVMWQDARNQKLPQGFCHYFYEESRIIKPMLSVNPEDRPEATKLKADFEEYKNSLESVLQMCRDGRTF